MVPSLWWRPPRKGSGTTIADEGEPPALMLGGKRASALGGRKAGRKEAEAAKVNSQVRGKPLSALEMAAKASTSTPTKSTAVKGKSLALEGIKGSPASPKNKALEAPRHRVSPRGKPLPDSGSGSGASALRMPGAGRMTDAPAVGGSSSEQARALASLHDRHVSLQKEHTSLQQAHAALQAKHRDSVGSCLVLLDQLKELQSRSDLDDSPPPGSARAAYGGRPPGERRAALGAMATGGEATSTGTSTRHRPAVDPHMRCTPRAAATGAAASSTSHSAPPHKQSPGQAHAAATAAAAAAGLDAYPVPHPLRLPDEEEMLRAAAGWGAGGASDRSSRGGGASHQLSGHVGADATPRQRGAASVASPRSTRTHATAMMANGRMLGGGVGGSGASPRAAGGGRAAVAAAKARARSQPHEEPVEGMDVLQGRSASCGREEEAEGEEEEEEEEEEEYDDDSVYDDRGADDYYQYEDDDDDDDVEDQMGDYDGDDAPYIDEEFEEDENTEGGISSGWAREEIEEEGEEEGYRDPYYEDEEDRLSPQDVEQLVERYLTTRKRSATARTAFHPATLPCRETNPRAVSRTPCSPLPCLVHLPTRWPRFRSP